MAVRVCAESELDPECALKVVIDGIPIVLAKDSDGTCHALGDTCSHAEISLSEGFVEKDKIECWAHGAVFDLKTGRALRLPATEPVPVYELSVVDGDIYIDVNVLVDAAG